MTITREQVADLQPGDVVELRLDEWDSGQAIRGPLTASGKYPGVLEIQIPGGDRRYWVRTENGRPFDGEQRTLTVVSRAPRPLYVNHPRTEPAPGDVVRVDDRVDHLTWTYRKDEGWHSTTHGLRCVANPFDGLRMRLLVDGETGQVVP